MKLRNKKTGEVGELHYEPDKKYHFTVATDDPADMTIHKTLAELNEEWEDYTPAEPLIKDEKIRKAVRAWAEANGRGTFKVINEHFNCCKIIGYTQNGIVDGGSRIEFGTTIAGAKQKYFYAIAELCGEEEE